MAFGFGFNKQKVLSAAEKYVQQGKMQNAIVEYEKVIKNDPKDLTVTNTVGDLYSRLGDADKATECFKTVGEAYATQGFTVKAIAMYKKISKLKPSLEGVLKLAELYTQQGLFNDARAQYLQVAEEFLRTGELDNAVRIFQKILEMDPENVNMRVRLAEVYVRLGKKTEAWQIFSAAAETLRSRGSLSGVEELLQRMLTLDPGNSYALLMQGRNLIESGDGEAAIKSFEKVTDLDSNPEGLRDLLKAYLQTGRLSDAGTLANKLLTVHNDLGSISAFADALMQAGQYENALQVYDQHADRLLAGNSAKVLDHLHTIIGHVRDNPASLDKLLDLFQKAGETTHLCEVIELLAHASVQSGDLTRARDLYQKLATIEPQNLLHLKSYQQVVSQLGGTTGTKLITTEEAAVIVDELEAVAPSVHQHYSDKVALAVRAALTDAELFISYNMPAQALGPLVAALPLAPQDWRLNQRLAALHTRAGRFGEAALCCRNLQNVYSEAGYPEEATRYGELAARYEERSTIATAVPEEALAVPQPNLDEAPVPQAAAPWPAFTPAVAAEPEAASVVAEPEFAIVEDDSAEASTEPSTVETSDISSEWEDSITVEQEATDSASEEIEITAVGDHDVPASADETIEEIRFYLAHGMPEQATAAFDKLSALTKDETKLAAIRAELEAAAPAAVIESAAVVEEIAVPVEEAPAPVEEIHAPVEVAASPEIESETSAPAPAALEAFVADLESSLGDTFLPGAVAHEVEATPAVSQVEAHVEAHVETAETVPAAPEEVEVAAQHEAPALGEFVADLEASLGEDFLKAAPLPVAEAAAAVSAQATPVVETHDVVPQIAPPPVVAPQLRVAAAAGASGGTTAGVPVTASSALAAPVFESKPQPLSVPPTASAVPATSSPFGEDAGVDLAEMFGELKHDLESGVNAADEDPETHYSLGIAFREMGLLDEAIGELQKASQAVDRGHPFPHVMQAYTWLAQCFLDKGVPEAAIRWYDKALIIPTIDAETRVALHYELAGAYEAAGDKPSALKHFMEVYGSNIDYRDVAERIKALKS
jgi:tetratricopeptide (TPR) repeat protein